MATINGTSGNNYLYGTAYADSIYADSGDDTVYAGGGNDYVDGWYGNDYIDGGSGNDTLMGYYGNDTLDGWSGDDKLYGEAGHDKLLGYDGNDQLYGGAGNDVVNGESGNDTLNGGGYGYNSYEYDTLSGGAGADKFVLGESYSGAYYTGGGYATITDFYWGEGDKFQVYGSQSDYSLDKSYNWSGGGALDTAIYYKGDLLAVAQDTTNVYLGADFNYVV
jgi:Ca2+-binding RTX toxin-like protein